MHFLKKLKDGGPESKVWAYVLIEIKWLFSIMLLKFEDGSREAYHSHAFNAISWVLSGMGLFEERIINGTKKYTRFLPGIKPIITVKNNIHKVDSLGTSWALTFRGPWDKTWKEIVKDEEIILTHGRIKV